MRYELPYSSIDELILYSIHLFTISTSPVACSSGHYSLNRYTNCVACPAGYSCANNNVLPVVCSAGTYSIGSSTTCTSCPAGYACPSIATASDQYACPSGELRCCICGIEQRRQLSSNSDYNVFYIDFQNNPCLYLSGNS